MSDPQPVPDAHPRPEEGPAGPVTTVPPRARRRFLGAALGLTGIVVVIVGTFLPWLTSGQVNRNSYAVAGLADRLLLDGGSVAAVAVGAWPYLGPALLLSVVAGAVRWWRTGAVIAGLGALIAGVVSGLAVSVGTGEELVRLNLLGPGVVLVGALATVAGAVVVLSAGRHRVVS